MQDGKTGPDADPGNPNLLSTLLRLRQFTQASVQQPLCSRTPLPPWPLTHAVIRHATLRMASCLAEWLKPE